jgi:hypothetical protein
MWAIVPGYRIVEFAQRVAAAGAAGKLHRGVVGTEVALKVKAAAHTKEQRLGKNRLGDDCI